MLHFNSAKVRIVNSERAIAECLDISFPEGIPVDCAVFIINSSLGHKLDKLGEALLKKVPHANIVGCSSSGVIGREGVGESMTDMALMAVSGPANEHGVAGVTGIYSHNSYEKGLELAKKLKESVPTLNAMYLLCPGIDINNGMVLKAMHEVFGKEVTIFGGTSSDNMRGLINFQYCAGIMDEHLAWAVGFADPTLKPITRATHGFTVYGAPLTVTKAAGNKIIEFDGKPAWSEFTKRLSLADTSLCGDTIPVGALGEKLSDDLAEEYGNTHILRVITKYDADGSIYYPVSCQEGLQLWLTNRDEDLIFAEQRRTLEYMQEQMGGKKPVAIFQTDCLARGRFLFNRVVKDELIAMMQTYLEDKKGEVPAWLGMYGFGEFAKLGDNNVYHNYSTALLALCR